MFQQFAGVASGAVGDFSAGEHAREFFNTAGAIEFVNAHQSTASPRFFLHDEVIIGKTSDLRLMRYTQHLVSLRVSSA